jgi:hypothetical protein
MLTRYILNLSKKCFQINLNIQTQARQISKTTCLFDAIKKENINIGTIGNFFIKYGVKFYQM